MLKIAIQRPIAVTMLFTALVLVGVLIAHLQGPGVLPTSEVCDDLRGVVPIVRCELVAGRVPTPSLLRDQASELLRLLPPVPSEVAAHGF